MRKIKILMLHLGYGGVEKQTILMANALASKYDIEIASFYKTACPFTISPKIKINYLTEEEPTRDLFWQSLKNLKLLKTFKIGLTSLKILFLKKYLVKCEILKNDADIYFATRMEYGVLLSKYGSSDKIKIVQEHNFIDSAKYLNNLARKIGNLDYVVVMSTWHEKTYRQFLKDTKVKVVRIPNILEKRGKMHLKSITNTLVAVGRFDPVKDFLTLIEVMKYLKKTMPNFTLYLIGDGSEKEKIESKIKEYKLTKNIIITGFLKPEQIAKIYEKADVFLITSLKECFPLVILEAYAHSLPVVSFAVLSGPIEMVKNNKTGYLIKRRNPALMADKIAEILTKPQKLKEMQKNSYEKSAEYLKENIMPKWEEIFNENC